MLTPASRAPSAIARTRPWYKNPPRSNTACVMPFSTHAAPSIFPTCSAALMVLPFHSSSPITALTDLLMVPSAAMVFWFSSSITCTYTCWLDLYTEMRGRSDVPETCVIRKETSCESISSRAPRRGRRRERIRAFAHPSARRLRARASASKTNLGPNLTVTLLPLRLLGRQTRSRHDGNCSR